MRYQAFVYVSSFFVTSASAAGPIEYSIKKLRIPGAPQLARRDTIQPALETNFDFQDGLAYYLNLTVGTPGQLQTIQLDTGSSDLYFSASNATFCQSQPGCAGGTFDPSKSSTFEVITPGGFNTSFGDGSTEAGDFVSDVIQIGDLVITGAQMGIAYDINSTTGANTALMGVGYSTNEGIQEDGFFYPNFIEALVGSGAINSRFFSLYLNDLQSYGNILFGGVDTDKFSGEMTSLNCFPGEDGVINNYYLILQEVTAQKYQQANTTVLSSSETSPYVYLPDSGSTAWEVPSNVYRRMIELMDVDPQYLIRPCSDVARGLQNATNLQFTFLGNGTQTATLNVEMADLFTPVTQEDGTALTLKGVPYCVLRIQESDPSEEVLVLGDAIMRAGYWVYDQDNGQVSVAQANLNADSSNVVEVQAGRDGLSRAVSNLRAATQGNAVAPTITASASYGLSTASNTVGYTSGAEAEPTVAASGSGKASGTGKQSGTRTGGSTSASTGAAASVIVPEFAMGRWSLAAVLLTFWVSVGFSLV